MIEEYGHNFSVTFVSYDHKRVSKLASLFVAIRAEVQKRLGPGHRIELGNVVRQRRLWDIFSFGESQRFQVSVLYSSWTTSCGSAPSASTREV